MRYFDNPFVTRVVSDFQSTRSVTIGRRCGAAAKSI